MKLRRLAFLPPVALGLMLAACDSRDYEAELAALQTDLESARGELEAAQSENEQMTTEMEELTAQAEQAGGLSEEASTAVQGELNTIIENASTALVNLTQVEAQAEGADVSGLRESVQQILQSAETTAQELGLEVEAASEGQEGQPQPAAGPTDQQQEEPAAAPPAGGEAPPAGEQPEGEQQQ